MVTMLMALRLAIAATGMLGALSAGALSVDPPAEGGQPSAAQDAPAADEIASAEELLLALENAGGDIRLLSAQILYDKTFAIQGDTQTRQGKLVFESRPGETEGAAPARRFGITFDRLQVGDRVEDETTEYLEQYIFDGEWLAEVYPKEKQFVRRQVVAPGERWDPLKIGEGPFPIPIQQKRDEILKRFDAELSSDAGMLDARPLQLVASRSYQLRLTPREDIGDDELREIRIWYDKESLLPRMARTVTKADDVSLVLLKGVKLNAEAEVSDAELSTEPPRAPGWSIAQHAYEDGR